MSRRLQLLLDEERYQRVAQAAADQRVSVATIIRDAVDAMLPGAAPARRAAGARLLDAAPMEVPDVAELQEELEGLRGRRA